MRRAITPALIAVFVLIAVISLRGNIPQPSTGNWLSAGAMTAPRSGAASALLQDGRILITGGDSGSGPLASAEFYDATGTFASAPAMGVARSAHTATVLSDGRVLVAGGSTGAASTNAAEIFDPITNSWTSIAGGMIVARVNHTASLLADGRVLLAGGDNAGAASASLEIFDPTAGSFSSVGTMSSPRTSFASAVLSNGQVLLVGGSNGTASLATTEIFDPQSNSISAGPSLSASRMGHSATTLLDGQVLVAGGTSVVVNSDGTTTSTDLSSAEIFDPAAATFTATTSTLAAPRSGHLAFLLPHNNSVLLIGGSSAGATIATAELFTPWLGTFSSTSPMSTARTTAVGSPLKLDGLLLIAGGKDSAAISLSTTEAYGFATIKTDAADYPPGSTVNISGSGWQPGETVTLTLVESPLLDTHGPYTVVADAGGNITDSSFTTDAHDENIRFYLTAAGSNSHLQAQETFTDSKPASVTLSPTPVTVAPGNSAVYTVTVNFNGNNDPCTSPLSIQTPPLLPTGAVASFSPSSVTSTGGNATSTLTITTTNTTPPSSTTFNVLAGQGGGTCQAGTATGTGTLVVVEDTTTSLTSSANPTTFGQSTTLTATVSKANGPTTPNAGTVTFKDGAATLGTGPLNPSGVATLAVSSLTAGPHNLTASYAGTASFAASNSNTVSQTVTQANTTTTVASSSNPSSSGTSVTFTATVVAIAPGSGTSTGTVTFKDGVTTLGTGTLASGIATFSTSALTVGTHNITAFYGGDTNFAASTSSILSQVVNQANSTTTLTSSQNPSVFGQSVTFTATVSGGGSGTPTGSVTFKDGVTTLGTGTLSGAGVATFSTSTLVAASHSITAVYGGDTNFSSSTSATLNQTVNAASTTTTITNAAALATGSLQGSPYSVTYTVSITAPGGGSIPGTDTVLVSDGTDTCTGTVAAGACSLTSTTTGNPKTITAKYIGSANYLTSTSAGVPHTVGVPPAITSATSATFTVATPGTFTVTATGSPAPTFTETGALPSGVTLNSTTGVLSGTPALGTVGSYPITITATNSVGANVQSFTLTVNKATPVFSALPASQTISFGTPTISVSGKVATSSDSVRAASADTVTVTINGVTSAPITFGGASGMFGPVNIDTHAIPASATPYVITYTYSGGANLISVTNTTTTLTVTKITPTVNWTAPAAITYNTALSATQLNATFTATVNGATVSVAGTATYTPPSGTVLNAGAGQTLSVSFAPTDTADYNSANGSTSITVNKANTSTAVTSSNLSAFFGSSVTLTATVTNASGTSGVPTGSVQFMDGASALGSPQTVNASGIAALTTSALTVGTHSITAVYSNTNNNFIGSTSAAISQVIKNAATTTTVSSSKNPSNFGDSVTFTASVAPQDAGAGMPTGSVQFQINGSNFGAPVSLAACLPSPNACAVSGATTSLSVSGSPHTITATYAPSGNFLTSTGSLFQTVSKANQTISFTTNAPATAAYNSSFSVAATATSGLTVSFTNAGACSNFGTTFTMTSGTGICSVKADQPGDANYNAATQVVQTTTAQAATQTISFTGAPASAAFGSTFAVSATATSGLTVTLAASGACSILGNVVTMTSGTGTCFLTADQAGDANYSAAPQTTQSTTALKVAATVVLSNLLQPYDGTQKSVTVVTNPLGLSVLVTYDNSSTAPTSAGSYAVVATITDTNYSGTATDTLVISQAKLLVEANYKTRAVNDSDPTFDATYVGFVNGDTTASLGGTLSCTTTAQNNSPAGDYPITCSGLTSSNYSLMYMPGVLTITNPITAISVAPSNPSIPVFTSQPFTANGTFADGSSRALHAGNNWSSVHDMNLSRSSAGVVALNGLLYAIGGSSSGGETDTVEVFDPNSNAWAMKASMPTARYGFAAAAIQGKIYAAGGRHNGATTDVLEVYDMASNIWSTKSPMLTPTETSGAMANGKLYVIGGNANGTCSNAVQQYDPANDTWTQKAPMPTSRCNLSVVAIDGLIYVLGGTNTGGSTHYATLEVYDPISNNWSTKADAPAAIDSEATANVDGLLYAIGGNSSGLSNVVESYSPATNTWTARASLPSAIASSAAAYLNGVLYNVGGFNGANPVATALALSPDDISWSSSDATVATINASGNANALKPGNTTIKATSLPVPPVTGDTLLTVIQATPTITWANPANINYGTALSATQLNATASVPGTFVYSPASGTVLSAGNNQTLNVVFTPTDTTDYTNADATASINVLKAHLTVKAEDKSKTYDGAPFTAFTATINGFVNGDTNSVVTGSPAFSGTAVGAINAGSYTITPALGTLTATNYDFTVFTNGTLLIGKAAAVITVTPYSLMYDGDPHTATGSAVGVETPSPASLTSFLHLDGTTHTDAGTYTDTWTFDGNTNYSATAGTVTDSIAKAEPVVVAVGGTFTYDGTPHAGSATATGVKHEPLTPVNIAYKDALNVFLTSAPVNAGSYTVAARFPGNNNYNQKQSASVALVITKADAHITVTPYNVTYDGNQHTAAGTATGVEATPANLTSLLHFDGTTHTNAGDYPGDAWSFDGNTNYNATTGTVTDTIAKASSVTAVVCPASVTYDGTPQTPCTASVTGVGGLSQTLSVSYSNNTNAGTASASATYPGDANHLGSSDSKNFTITKANSSTVVTCPPSVTYDGTAQTPCTAVATGAGALSVAVTVTYTNNTGAGTASASATYPGDANHLGSSDSKTFLINQAVSSTLITCPPSVNYGGTAQTPCTAVATGAGALSVAVTVTYTNNTGAGTASASATYPGDANHLGSSDSKTFMIAKAVSLTVVTCPAMITYSGLAQTPCSVAVTGVGGLSLSPAPTYSNNLNAGNAAASYSYVGDDNHLPSNGSKMFMIAQAPLTITASSGSMIYGGPIFPVTPSYAGFVNGEGPAVLSTQPSCGTAATSQSPVSTYISSCSGAAAANYSISYLNGMVSVTPAMTTTTVTSSLNPSNWGQVAIFTVTVAPQFSGIPTGSVSFYNAPSGATCQSLAAANASTLDVEPLPVGANQVSTSTAWLPVGTDTVLACYSGDTNFFGGNGAVAQTVIAAPIAKLDPASLSFGNQQGGTISGPQTLAISNPNGTAPLLISSIKLAGTNPTYFTETDSCSSVAVGGSCTITVKFAPPANTTGVATAIVVVTDNDENAPGSTQSSLLTGAGISSINSVGSLSTYGVFATANGCSSINMSGNAIVDSINSGTNNNGNVGTNGNANLSGNPVVNGAVYSPIGSTGNCSSKSVTGLSTSGKAQATGGLQALAGPLTYPAPPAPSPAPPTTAQNISGSCGSVAGCSPLGSKTVTLAPGQYGNLSITGGTTVHFGGGTYNFNSLTLSGNSALVVDSGTLPVIVNLAGKSITGGNAVLDLTGGVMSNSTGQSNKLQFYYAGSQPVKLSGNTASYAVVYAPNAAINLSGGSHFYGAITGSTVNNSGGTAIHYDASLPNIPAGDYIWFNSAALNVKGLPASGSVKVYVTNASISFPSTPSQCSGAFNITSNQCTLPVPNAVVTFSSTATTATTTWDVANSRWSTLVPTNGSTSVQTHTFIDGLAYLVPAAFPSGIQNVTWSAAFSTSTTGVSFSWQWGAAVYSSFNTNPSSFGVNPIDSADPAGTPGSYKSSLVFGATGPGYIGLYTGAAGVVPTIAEASVAPSSLDFTIGGTTTQNVGTTSTPLKAVLTNNMSGPLTITGVLLSGTNLGDFMQTNDCPASLPSGLACTITVTFTPSAPGKRTAKVVVNDSANNTPQTVFLKGAGQ